MHPLPANTATIDPATFFYTVIACGILGGMACLALLTKKQDGRFCIENEPVTGRQDVLVYLLKYSLSGCASAIGIFLIFHFLHQDFFSHTLRNLAVIAGASVIAGFAANRFLPRYARSLDQKLEDLEKGINSARNEAQEATAVAAAQPALRDNAPHADRVHALNLLRPAFERNRKDRALTITLGRLLRKMDQLEMAISYLNQFLEEKTKAGERDKDFADILYNRACYKSLIAKYLKDKPGKIDLQQKMTKQAIDDLRLSIEISEQNRDDARSDSDFDFIRQEADFVTLMDDQST